MTPDKSIEEIIKDEAEEKYPVFGGFTSRGLPHEIYTGQKYKREGYIAGRSEGIESERAKDERIKKLKEELGKAIKVIKQWHNADEVWDIYFNNAPEMKSIRELLNNK